MNDLISSTALWLADFGLLSAVLLTLALVTLVFVNQPAGRLAITKSTLLALFLLAALCTLPGWSLMHLLSPQQRPNGSPVPASTIALDTSTPQAPAFNSELPSPTSPSPNASVTPPAPSFEWRDLPWLTLAVSVYATGSACVVVWLCLGALAAHRLVRAAQPAPEQLVELLQQVTKNDRRGAKLLVSPNIDIPVALGTFRPTVLLPATWIPLPFREGLGEGSSFHQLRTILAHEAAHLRNHDLRWLAVSRALLVLLWPQPLFWLLRRRMRLDQETLADAAAAEHTSRQHYAEQLVTWARHMAPRPAVRLSSAVGLWEGPSQLRQRIALLIDEHITVLHECSRNWRLASLLVCTLLAVGLSLVTLQPVQSEPSDRRTEQVKKRPNNATEVDESDHVAIDDRFIFCRVTTDLQRSLLGDVSRPEIDASLCVFVNFAAFPDDQNDMRSPAFATLSEKLAEFAKRDNRFVSFRVLVAPSNDVAFQRTQERAHSLAKLCEQLGRAAGYKRAQWSTTYYGEDFNWTEFIERAKSAARLADSDVEKSVGDDQVQVFPVRTFLARLLVKADCVVNIIPVVRQKVGTQFPDDFVPAMTRWIPQLNYERKQTILIRVQFTESAKDRLEQWVNDRAARRAFAAQFGFENCNLEQSLTVDPDDGSKTDATKSGAANQPVDIPIVVAKHVMLHDGKIINWDDIERLIAGLPNPKLAHPGFYFTHGALPEREKEIRAKIWELRKGIELGGHSWSSISPRTSLHYDAIRTAADLAPDETHRIEGIVQTADGKPVDGAEIVLCPAVDEAIDYQTVDIYLRNERLRNPLDDIVTVSDASGKFAVYPAPDAKYYVVALHKEGFGLVRSDQFAKSNRVEIQPWAHITGKVKQDVRFKQSADMNVLVPADAEWAELRLHQYSVDLGPPSPDGRFELAFIPPSLRGWLSRSVKGEKGRSFGLPVKEFNLAPGETLAVDIEPPTDEEVKRIEEISLDIFDPR